jgi:T5SS/PEP-CTERM-associated repeat protein/autotransporter-associated beta strand protein
LQGNLGLAMTAFPCKTIPASMRLAAALVFAALLLCMASSAMGVTKTWTVGSGSWDVGDNWDPSGQPQAGEDAYLTQSDGVDRTVTYYNTTNPTAVLGILRIDATGTGAMTLSLPNNHNLSVVQKYVAFNGTGAVSQSAGTSDAGWFYVGFKPGSSGAYTLTGGTLSSSTAHYVGYSGKGTLSIESGGQASNAYSSIGNFSKSSGTVTVDGIGSKYTNSSWLQVGYGGTGTLRVQNGGEVTSSGGCLGNSGGSDGTVTVDGLGSKWTNSLSLYVGYFGVGALNIKNGGQASNTAGYLGYNSESSGTVTVDGTASVWTNTGSLYVGGSDLLAGGMGSVTVKSGGCATVAGTLKTWKADSAVTVNGGTLAAGALAGPAGSLRLTDPAGSAALTVGSAASETFSGTILDDTGPGSLAKVGGGTQTFAGANTYSGGTTVSEGTLLVTNIAGSGTGTGAVTVDAATLGGTGFINGPVTLTGDSTLTSTGTLTINNTLTIQGLANQLSSGTVLTSGDVTIEPGAVFIINGTLGGDTGSLIVFGTLMGKGTINKGCIIEAGGVLSPGSPSMILSMPQVRVAATPRNFSFEIGAAGPNYATPSNSLNDLVRLTNDMTPFADATGIAPAHLTADTVIDVYFVYSDPAEGTYKAQFFASTDFSDAIADATFQYWRLDPHGNRLYNGNFYSSLDASLVDWSVVPETAMFGGTPASGYITQFAVVPEPASAAILVAGFALAFLRRRRGEAFARGSPANLRARHASPLRSRSARN